MSKKTGIPIDTLNKYVALRSTPSAINALKIAEALGIPLEKLAAPDGVISDGDSVTQPSPPNENTQSEGEAGKVEYAQLDPAILEKLNTALDQLSKLTAEKINPPPVRNAPPPSRPATVTYLPFLASAGAGSVVLDDSPGDQLDIDGFSTRILRMNRKNMRLIEIVGDSMLPTFVSGDYVVADTSLPQDGGLPDNGKLYVILKEGELLIKRAIWVNEDILEWTSDNSYYPPIRLESEDIDQVKIVGKVRWLIRKAE